VRFFLKNEEWVIVDSVRGFEGWKMPTRDAVKQLWRAGVSAEREHGIWDLMPKMETREKLWIVERKGWVR
jgi:hypothetical protein